MKFSLPIKAVSTLNESEHWAARAKRVKAHRSGATLAIRGWWLAKASIAGWSLDDGIQVSMSRVAPKPLDSHDNLRASMKPIVDGVADALDLKSDNDERVTWLYSQRKGGVREYAVEIEITERP